MHSIAGRQMGKAGRRPNLLGLVKGLLLLLSLNFGQSCLKDVKGAKDVREGEMNW